MSSCHLHIAALPSAHCLAWLQQEAGHKAAEQKREQEAQAAVHAAEAAAQHAQEKTQQQQKQQPAASPEQNQQQAGPSGAGPASGGTMAGTAAAAGRVEVTAASLLRISDSARAAEAQAWEVLSRARVSQRRLLEACCIPQLMRWRQ